MLVRVPYDTTTIVVLRNSSNRSGGIAMTQLLDILYSKAPTDTTLFDTDHSDADEITETDTTSDSVIDSIITESADKNF